MGDSVDSVGATESTFVEPLGCDVGARVGSGEIVGEKVIVGDRDTDGLGDWESRRITTYMSPSDDDGI